MVDGVASVAVADRFSYALAYLTDSAVDLLVANACLDQHSGNDLVRLAVSMRLPMRSVVYTIDDDFECARETQHLNAFYERTDDGIPGAWLQRMRASLRTLGPEFSATRMLAGYTERAYRPHAAMPR